MPWIELLGLAAGTLVLLSSIPQLLKTFAKFRRGESDKQSLARNAGLAGGNSLWVTYGTLTQAWPLVFFCGLNVVLLATLSVLIVLSRRRKREAAGAEGGITEAGLSDEEIEERADALVHIYAGAGEDASRPEEDRSRELRLGSAP